MKISKNVFIKPLSILIAFTFLFTSIAWPETPDYTPFDENQNQSQFLTQDQLDEFSSIKKSLIDTRNETPPQLVTEPEIIEYLYDIIIPEDLASLTNLETLYDQSVAAREEAQAKYENLLLVLASYYEEVENAKTELDNVYTQIDFVSGRIGSLENEKTQASNVKSSLENDVNTKTNEAQTYLDDSSSIEGELSLMYAELNSLTTNKGALKKLLDDAEAVLNEKTNQKQTLENELSVLLEDLNARTAELISKEEALSQEEAELQDAIDLVHLTIASDFDIYTSTYEKIYDIEGNLIGVILPPEYDTGGVPTIEEKETILFNALIEDLQVQEAALLVEEKQALKDAAQTAYDNKLAEYNSFLSEYNQAVTDYETALANYNDIEGVVSAFESEIQAKEINLLAGYEKAKLIETDINTLNDGITAASNRIDTLTDLIAEFNTSLGILNARRLELEGLYTLSQEEALEFEEGPELAAALIRLNFSIEQEKIIGSLYEEALEERSKIIASLQEIDERTKSELIAAILNGLRDPSARSDGTLDPASIDEGYINNKLMGVYDNVVLVNGELSLEALLRDKQIIRKSFRDNYIKVFQREPTNAMLDAFVDFTQRVKIPALRLFEILKRIEQERLKIKGEEEKLDSEKDLTDENLISEEILRENQTIISKIAERLTGENLSSSLINNAINFLTSIPSSLISCGIVSLSNLFNSIGQTNDKTSIAQEAILTDIIEDNLSQNTESGLQISLFALQNAAEANGIELYGRSLTEADLVDTTLPFIAHVSSNHYVMVRNIINETVTFLDPSANQEITTSLSNFMQDFTGNALTLDKEDGNSILPESEMKNIYGAGWFSRAVRSVRRTVRRVSRRVSRAVRSVSRSISRAVSKSSSKSSSRSKSSSSRSRSSSSSSRSSSSSSSSKSSSSRSRSSSSSSRRSSNSNKSKASSSNKSNTRSSSSSSSTLGSLFKKATSLATRAVNTVKNVVSTVANTVSSAISATKSFVSNTVSSVKRVTSSIVNKGRSVVSSVKSFISRSSSRNSFHSGSSSAISTASSLTNTITAIAGLTSTGSDPLLSSSQTETSATQPEATLQRSSSGNSSSGNTTFLGRVVSFLNIIPSVNALPGSTENLSTESSVGFTELQGINLASNNLTSSNFDSTLTNSCTLTDFSSLLDFGQDQSSLERSYVPFDYESYNEETVYYTPDQYEQIVNKGSIIPVQNQITPYSGSATFGLRNRTQDTSIISKAFDFLTGSSVGASQAHIFNPMNFITGRMLLNALPDVIEGVSFPGNKIPSQNLVLDLGGGPVSPHAAEGAITIDVRADIKSPGASGIKLYDHAGSIDVMNYLNRQGAGAKTIYYENVPFNPTQTPAIAKAAGQLLKPGGKEYLIPRKGLTTFRRDYTSYSGYLSALDDYRAAQESVATTFAGEAGGTLTKPSGPTSIKRGFQRGVLKNYRNSFEYVVTKPTPVTTKVVNGALKTINFAKKVAVPLMIVGGIIDGIRLLNAYKKDQGRDDCTFESAAGEVAGRWSAGLAAGKIGGMAGAAIGGAIGSIVPGAGTAAGATIGGFVGAVAGGITGAIYGGGAGEAAGEAYCESEFERTSSPPGLIPIDTGRSPIHETMSYTYDTSSLEGLSLQPKTQENYSDTPISEILSVSESETNSHNHDLSIDNAGLTVDLPKRTPIHETIVYDPNNPPAHLSDDFGDLSVAEQAISGAIGGAAITAPLCAPAYGVAVAPGLVCTGTASLAGAVGYPLYNAIVNHVSQDKESVSLGTAFAEPVGTMQDVHGLVFGEDPITGDEYTGTQRGLSGLAVLLPFLGGRMMVNMLGEADEALGATKHLDELDEAIDAGKASSRADEAIDASKANNVEYTNPKNLRGRQDPSEFSNSKMNKIKKNMKTNGYTGDPIDVYQAPDGRYYIIDGHHRARAAGGAGLDKVPIRKLTEQELKAGWRLTPDEVIEQNIDTLYYYKD